MIDANAPGSRGKPILSTHLRMKHLVLHLVAVAIVSFTIGFGILALSGMTPFVSEHPFFGLNKSSLEMKSTSLNVTLDAVGSADVAIVVGAGHLAVRNGTEPGLLARAEVWGKAPGEPFVDAGTEGTKQVARLQERTPPGEDEHGVSISTWKVGLTDRVPLALTVNAGRGSSTLDLGSLNLSSLHVMTGIGRTEIDLRSYRGIPFDGTVAHSLGDLVIRVPKDEAVRIAVLDGVGDLRVRGLSEQDGSYITQPYAHDQPRISISVMQGVGTLVLEAN